MVHRNIWRKFAYIGKNRDVYKRQALRGSTGELPNKAKPVTEKSGRLYEVAQANCRIGYIPRMGFVLTPHKVRRQNLPEAFL